MTAEEKLKEIESVIAFGDPNSERTDEQKIVLIMDILDLPTKQELVCFDCSVSMKGIPLFCADCWDKQRNPADNAPEARKRGSDGYTAI